VEADGKSARREGEKRNNARGVKGRGGKYGRKQTHQEVDG